MTIIDEAKLFVIDFFEKNRSEKLTFHSIEHTMSVVRQAEVIGIHEKLSETELSAVIIASWFHDVGYLVQLNNHEDASISIVRSFFETHLASPEFIELVVHCIEATKRRNEPASIAEKVILDADVSHLGFDNFISLSKKLKMEVSLCQEKEVPAFEYWSETLRFMNSHVFYTSYGQQKYLPVKEQNKLAVALLVAKQEGKDQDDAKKTKEKAPSTEKGIETMFRITSSNQVRLSAIADKKANILISINSIFLSGSAAVASKAIEINKELIIPLIVLFIFCLLSLIFSIVSCRPKLGSNPVTVDDLNQRKINLLFFGNFHQIPYPDYEVAVKEMMTDYDYLYSSMIKDQYSLGLSLARKYKLLLVAYNVFMYGIISAASSFAIVFFLFK